MVVGGWNDANNDVELIDLSDENRSCAKPVDYPGAEYSAVGAFLNNEAIFCSGYPYTTECYTYNQDNRTWTKATFELNRGKC